MAQEPVCGLGESSDYLPWFHPGRELTCGDRVSRFPRAFARLGRVHPKRSQGEVEGTGAEGESKHLCSAKSNHLC
jgi:hypothetical protein